MFSPVVLENEIVGGKSNTLDDKTKKFKENDKNTLNENDLISKQQSKTQYNDSFDSQFKLLSLGSERKLSRPRITNTLPLSSRPVKPSPFIDKSEPKKNISIFKHLNSHTKLPPITITYQCAKEQTDSGYYDALTTEERAKLPSCPATQARKSDELPPIVETPLKSEGNQFITPSVQMISKRRPTASRLFPQTKVQKSLSEIQNEFQSKVLYSTPNAGPSLPYLSNHSAELSLDNSFLDALSPDIVSNRQKETILEKLSLTEEKDENVFIINGKKYVIKKKIGTGGSSSVYLTGLKDTNQEFAIKVCTLSQNTNYNC